MWTIARSMVLVTLIHIAWPRQAQALPEDAEYSYRANGWVVRQASNGRFLYGTTGFVSASDESKAREKASAEVSDFVRQRYPGYVEDLPARTISVVRAVGANAPPNQVTLRATVTCNFVVVKQKENLSIAGITLSSESVAFERFNVRILTDVDGITSKSDFVVASMGHGHRKEQFQVLDLWKGDFQDGDLPKSIGVRVFHQKLPDLSQHPAQIEANPSDPNDGYIEVGSVTIQLSHAGGRLAVDWQSSANAKSKAARPSSSPVHSRQFRLAKEGAVPLDLNVSASKASDAQDARARIAEDENKKRIEMQKKLAEIPPGVRLYRGSVRGTDPGPKGTTSEAGIGPLVVISSNREVALGYLQRAFPNEFGRGGYIFAPDEAQAKTELRRLFFVRFPKATPIGEPTLTEKTGRDNGDRLQERPPSGPRKIKKKMP